MSSWVPEQLAYVLSQVGLMIRATVKVINYCMTGNPGGSCVSNAIYSAKFGQ